MLRFPFLLVEIALLPLDLFQDLVEFAALQAPGLGVAGPRREREVAVLAHVLARTHQLRPDG